MLVAGKNRESTLKEIAQQSGADMQDLQTKPAGAMYVLRTPGIGLYKSWVANMDEGWTRWVLEQYDFSFKILTDADIRAGDLHKKFDVIILPDQSARSLEAGHDPDRMPPEYANGLGEIGVHQLRTFVECRRHAGGTGCCNGITDPQFWIQITMHRGLPRKSSMRRARFCACWRIRGIHSRMALSVTKPFFSTTVRLFG
jgi:hypothetical protein